MSQAPVQLIVAAFNDEKEAELALKELKRAKKEKLIGINAAAIIRRDQKNKMHIKEVGELTTGQGAVGGAILGVALGIITGGAGLLLGAVGALVGGIIGKATDFGFDNKRLKEIEKLDREIERLQWDLDQKKGKYILRDDFEMELAARAVVLESGLRHLIRSRLPEFMATAGAEENKIPGSVEQLNTALDSLMNDFANTEKFQVMIVGDEA